MEWKLAVLLLSAALPCSCAFREGNEENAAPDGKVRFTAVADDTRTAFAEAEGGTYPCLWTGNNECVALSLNWGETQVAAVSASEDGRSAGFELEFDAPEAQQYVFSAFSPASSVSGMSESRRAWSISLPVDQRPLDGSCDESAQLISAQTSGYSILPGKVQLAFRHVSAYGRLAISGLQNGDTAILGVELTSSVPFAGNWYYSPEDGSLADNGASSTLFLETGTVDDVWFACMPCEMGGKTLSISILTEAGTFTKTIRPRAGLAFEAGKVARISVDFSGIEATGGADVFTLVTAVSALSKGDEILIVNAESTYALGEQQSGSTDYRALAAVSVTDGVIGDSGAATVLTLGSGSTSGTWTLSDGKGYLASKSSKNNLTRVTSVNGNSSWSISIASSGIATIKAQSGSSTYIRYNKTAARFSCYSSATNLLDVCIYKKGSGGGPAADDPLLDYAQYGLDLGGLQRFYVPGTDQYARQYDASGVQTFALLEAEGNEQLEITGYRSSMRKGDRATFTILWRKGLITRLSGNWDLTLVREDGPKVWLSDGNGGGVIIKK